MDAIQVTEPGGPERLAIEGVEAHRLLESRQTVGKMLLIPGA